MYEFAKTRWTLGRWPHVSAGWAGLLALACLVALMIPATTAAQDVDAPLPVDELRAVCRTIHQQHFSRAARQRAENFLRWTAPRLWHDDSSRFSTMASYLDQQPDAAGLTQVTLRKTLGDVVQVPLDRLSTADQRVVRELAEIVGRIGEDAESLREHLEIQVRNRQLDAYSSGMGSQYTIPSVTYPYSYGATSYYPYSYGYYPYGVYYGATPYYGYGYSYGYNYGHHRHHGAPYRPAPSVPSVPSVPRGPRSPLTGGNVYGY